MSERDTTHVWAVPTERSERHYLDFKVAEHAVLEEFIPSEFRGEGFSWSVHSDGDGMVRFIRTRTEEWTALGDKWQKKPPEDRELEMVPSKREVIAMIEERAGQPG